MPPLLAASPRISSKWISTTPNKPMTMITLLPLCQLLLSETPQPGLSRASLQSPPNPLVHLQLSREKFQGQPSHILERRNSLWIEETRQTSLSHSNELICIWEAKENYSTTLSSLPKAQVSLKGEEKKRSQLTFMLFFSKVQQVNSYQKKVETEITEFIRRTILSYRTGK